MEIKPDFSIMVSLNGEPTAINRVYDNVHLFPSIGHSILKIVCEEGFLQWHTTISAGQEIADATGIIPVVRSEMAESEYDSYIQYQAEFLSDDWLE